MGSNSAGDYGSYLRLYLHPWALRGEAHAISFSAQARRQEVKQ